MTKANLKAFILLRHMQQINDPRDRSFWAEKAKLDPSKETFAKTSSAINNFLLLNELELVEVASSPLIRAIETAQGITKNLPIEPKWVNYSNDSGQLTPQIKAWESLMRHCPASIENTEAMYASGSKAKGLLMFEGYNLLEYIQSKIKRMQPNEAKILVTHSPLIEALESATTKQWDIAPKTLAKGEAIALIFDENNEFVEIENVTITSE